MRSVLSSPTFFPLAAKGKYDPKLAVLDKVMSPYLGGGSVRLDGNPRAIHILDSVSSFEPIPVACAN